MKTKLSFFIGSLILLSSISYALNSNPRFNEIVLFYDGHKHLGEEVVGAPSHSGGTDRYGCHNASVPYHCH